MREEFEKLPEIAERIKTHNITYHEVKDTYSAIGHTDNYSLVADLHFVGGAWYAFQEQQKKIDEIVRLIHNETSDYELDAKIKEILK